MPNAIDLDSIDEKQLLQLKLSHLPIRIENTWLQQIIEKLYSELAARGLAFRPPCYLGDEWFSPDGVAAIALPFYLTHPRLIQLEKKMIGEAEGEDPGEAMRLLRHECGHAFVHAFQLTKRKSWREVFGHPRKAFSDYYKYRPYSKSYVRNLKNFYAQSHPEEDFAESFAVWLNPDEDWRTLYAGWPALHKLEYIESLVPSLGKKTVRVKKAQFYFRLDSQNKRLDNHYRQKKKLYIEYETEFFDADLKLIFPIREFKKKSSAARFLASHRQRLENYVARSTGEKKVMVKNLIQRLKKRCEALKLETDAAIADETLIQFTAYLTSLVSNFHYTSRYKPEK